MSALWHVSVNTLEVSVTWAMSRLIHLDPEYIQSELGDLLRMAASISAGYGSATQLRRQWHVKPVTIRRYVLVIVARVVGHHALRRLTACA